MGKFAKGELFGMSLDIRLRSQLVSFGYAPFQSSIQQLKDTVDSRLGHPDPQGPVGPCSFLRFLVQPSSSTDRTCPRSVWNMFAPRQGTTIYRDGQNWLSRQAGREAVS